jgi:hypothetical protein
MHLVFFGKSGVTIYLFIFAKTQQTVLSCLLDRTTGAARVQVDVVMDFGKIQIQLDFFPFVLRWTGLLRMWMFTC